MKKPHKPTERQLEIISSFAEHRGAVDSYTNGPEVESITLSTVREALELLGHDESVIELIAKMIGASQYLRDE